MGRNTAETKINFKGEIVMKDLLKKFSKKSCCLILKETDLIKVLDILDARRLSKNISIRKNDSSNWYIMFRATKRAWDALIRDLDDNHIKDILIPTRDNFGDVFYQQI